MRSAILVALLAVVACFSMVEALNTVRTYRNNGACSGSAYYNFASTGTCWTYNDTGVVASGVPRYVRWTTCNDTTSQFAVSYYTTSGCSGVASTTSGTTDSCRTGTLTSPGVAGQSYYVVCSAGSIAFSAVAVIAAIIALLL